jgi:hypothetical protein
MTQRVLHTARCLAVAGALMASDPLAGAADLHVSTAGVDGPGCGSAPSPCRTLQGAHAVASDGDTLIVGPGRHGLFSPSKDLTIRGAGAAVTELEGCDASVCGGAPTVTVARGVTITFEGFTFRDADGWGHDPGSAGAVAVFGDFTCRHCVFTANRADHGSAIGVAVGATLHLIHSTVFGNRSDHEGAIENHGTATIESSTVSGNVGDESAGIYNTGTLTIVSSTIASNVATFEAGGGIGNRGTVLVRNSVIAGNRAAQGPDCTGGLVSLGYNVVGNAAGCALSGGNGTDLIGVDALLGPLGWNGGPTPTHAPRFRSPVIDAANPAGCVDAAGAPLATDQRGAPREDDGDCDTVARCDIGAFESPCLPAPILYESDDAADVVSPAHAVGTATSNPIEHAPAALPALFYQADDGAGSPATILLAKGARGNLLVHLF